MTQPAAMRAVLAQLLRHADLASFDRRVLSALTHMHRSCFSEQRLGLLEVGHVQAVDEPLVHRLQDVLPFNALALITPEPS
jgi:hypothetical protein